MERNDIYTDKILKDILNKSTVIKPSNDFTDNVMAQVSSLEPSWEKAMQPIISKKGWIILSISVSLLIVFVVTASIYFSGESTKHISYFQNIGHIIDSANIYISKLFSLFKPPVWLPLGFVFILVALFFDSILRRIFRINKAA